jgi:hypothetical protein
MSLGGSDNRDRTTPEVCLECQKNHGTTSVMCFSSCTPLQYSF